MVTVIGEGQTGVTKRAWAADRELMSSKVAFTVGMFLRAGTGRYATSIGATAT